MQTPFLGKDNDDDDDDDYRAHVGCNTQTRVSVGVNVVLTCVQIAVGVYAKSQALVADGLNSLSDLIADGVVLFASHHSQKDADHDHPYGHQRFETAASLVLGLLLLAVGVGMLWLALQKLQSPASIQQAHVVALWVAAAALASKELLYRYPEDGRHGRHGRGGRTPGVRRITNRRGRSRHRRAGSPARHAKPPRTQCRDPRRSVESPRPRLSQCKSVGTIRCAGQYAPDVASNRP